MKHPPINNPCTWIGESPRLKPSCCKPSIAGRNYCKDHIWLVYKEGSEQRRRKKDECVAAAVWDLESEFNLAIEELVAEGFDI